MFDVDDIVLHRFRPRITRVPLLNGASTLFGTHSMTINSVLERGKLGAREACK